MTDEAQGTPGRVAVVAVHGVADQAPGETVHALAALMTAQPPEGVRYGGASCDCVMLAVAPLPGCVEAMPDPAGRPPLMKALRQSLRSDFHREGWLDKAAAGHEKEAVRANAMAYQASVHTGDPAAPAATGTPDPGVAFTDYLLFKAQRGHAATESFESERIRLQREQAGTSRPVVFHEMYWADLSRLSSALPSILTELFTILFRLSKLGRDTIDQARRGAVASGAPAPVQARWRRLCWLQAALDWSFAHVLANLFLQMLLLGGFIVVMAALNGDAGGTTAAAAQAVVAVAAPLLALWWLAYRHVISWDARLMLILLAAAAGFTLWQLYTAPWVLGLIVLAALGLACDAGLKVADRRFVAARRVGLVFLAISAAVIAVVMLRHAPSAYPPAPDPPDFPSPPLPPQLDTWVWWTAAALRAFELMLMGSYVWWGLTALLLPVWTYYGVRQAGLGAEARSSIATARLGLFVSVTSLTAVGMVIWAGGHEVIEHAAGKWGYRPWLFDLQFDVAGDGWGFPLLADHVRRVMPAESFLTLRYIYSTATFFLLAMLLFALLVYVLAMLVPSVMAELRRSVGTAGNLGRWLTGGYEHLERYMALIAVVSVAITLCVGLLILIDLTRLVSPLDVAEWKLRLTGTGLGSQTLLAPFVVGSVSALGALTLFGRTLSKYAPWLRAPLDAMLDVDSYLREFPRQAIPRARIFARYVALLEQLRREGTTRVVIVAHSQGTVITADLLRYLTYRAARGGTSRAAVLGRWLDEVEVHLVTAGSPLRQLYAARFPDLYHWVLAGPDLRPLNVDRWTTLFTAGDYVGRWIWAPRANAQRTPGFYAHGTQAAQGPPFSKDVCLGSGAHTHYFDPVPGNALVARCIDELIAGAP